MAGGGGLGPNLKRGEYWLQNKGHLVGEKILPQQSYLTNHGKAGMKLRIMVSKIT